MKTLLITIIAIGMLSSAVSAQTNIFPSTGNVGIGTTSPTSHLEINATAALVKAVESRTTGVNLSGIFNTQTPTSSGMFGSIASNSNNPFNSLDGVYVMNRTSGSNLYFTTNNAGTERKVLTMTSTGYVGIGTTSPADLLNLNSGANRKGITLTSDGNSAAYSDIELSINTTTGLTTGKPLAWYISHRKDGYFSNNPSGQSSLEFYAALKGGGYVAPLAFKSNGDVILTSSVNATAGNVGIGTTNPDQKLTVNGTIHSKSVIVDLTVVPDYVFKPAYKLPSLDYVKSYIGKNSHLPEVPSEAEIKKNGLDVGEMNAVLLKKVEELTLYLLELNKTVKAQQEEIKKLKANRRIKIIQAISKNNTK